MRLRERHILVDVYRSILQGVTPPPEVCLRCSHLLSHIAIPWAWPRWQIGSHEYNDHQAAYATAPHVRDCPLSRRNADQSQLNSSWTSREENCGAGEGSTL